MFLVGFLGRTLNLESALELALFFKFLMQKIVSCGHLVVFVLIKTHHSKIGFESKLVQIAHHAWLDRDLILANDESFRLADGLVLISVPGVVHDLLRGQPLVRIGLHDSLQHVLAVLGKILWHLEFTGENLLVQL